MRSIPALESLFRGKERADKDPGYTAVAPPVPGPAKAAVKFTLEEACLATRHAAGGDSTLVDLFPMYEENLEEIFGPAATGMQKLRLMETILSENVIPDPGQPLEKGTVKFSNLCGEGFLVLGSNFKDKQMASFHASDVIRMQTEKAEFQGPMKCIVVKDIISKEAKAYFEENRLEDMDYLNGGQCLDFLTRVSPTAAYLMDCFHVQPKSMQLLSKPGVPTVVIGLEAQPPGSDAVAARLKRNERTLAA